tara:strand:- start:139 stop:510 length:372 start_codon:yes stop_codon:yes gene_type:complete
MTIAPEKMWVFPKANWFIAGASTDRICTGGRLDVAYTRTDIADARTAELERAEKAVIDLIEQNAELIKQNETLRAEVARLKAALDSIVLAFEYSEDGKHALDMRILDMYEIAFTAKAHGEADQ